MTVGVALNLVWTIACPAQGVDVGISMTRATVPAPPAIAKPPEVKLPVPVREFVQTMKALASKESAPYKERIIPENPKADLGKILTYVGPNGLEFVDFDDDGDPQRSTIRRIPRAHLAKQIQMRKGKQLLWLMEVAFYFKWWTATPSSIQVSEPGVLVVTFGDQYELTFKDQPTGLQLLRLKSLQGPEGGV
jgi:hypothetical protein